MHRGRLMSDQEKAIVRACLDQVIIGMTEAREVLTFWSMLGEKRRQEWKDFAASVTCYHRELESSSSGGRCLLVPRLLPDDVVSD
jgi:hypothetical protein